MNCLKFFLEYEGSRSLKIIEPILIKGMGCLRIESVVLF